MFSSSSSRVDRYLKELNSRTLPLPIILLVMYTPVINLCTVITFDIIGDMFNSDLCHASLFELSDTAKNIISIIRSLPLGFLIPIMGWAADTKIGRHTAIRASLWSGWIGTLLQSLSFCFQYSSCGTLSLIGRYGISWLALIFLVLSHSLFYPNVLPLGCDQMICSESIKIRAFIHWHIWSFFLAGNCVFVIILLPVDQILVAHFIITFLTFVLFSVCLCLHFYFQSRFESINFANPYKIVFDVLRYTWHNKYPRNRSAFTYWEDKLPKRIDFAKTKFGGPFSHEHVENVKTFFQILTILAATSFFFMMSDPVTNDIGNFVDQYKDGYDSHFSGFAIFFVGDGICLIAIPILELILLPLFPKLEYFLINPLKGFRVIYISIILSIFSLFAIDLFGRMSSSQTIPCYTTWTPHDPYINVSFWFLLIPSLFAGIADVLSFICMFEFLCSQAPSGMKGMLIGIFWFMRAVCIGIGSFVALPFQYIDLQGPSYLSCTSWLMIVLGSIVCVGFLVYMVASCRYVSRIRDEDLHLRAAVEEHYEKMLLRNE